MGDRYLGDAVFSISVDTQGETTNILQQHSALSDTHRQAHNESSLKTKFLELNFQQKNCHPLCFQCVG